MVAQRFLEYAEKRAKERQVEAGKDNGRGQEKLMVNLPQPITEERVKPATDEVTKEFKVSGKTVRDAKVVDQQGTPEEKKEVLSLDQEMQDSFNPPDVGLI